MIGQYSYDGSGARVKKYVPSTGETTIFVYDAGGALAAEYSTIVAPVSEAKTSYLTTDHLGSPRVITDADGEVIARRDFMPFGEELGVGVGPRTEPLKYSLTNTDNIRQRFTGYQKDDETQLDFAEARMYQNKHGRFTAVDPLLASASAADPQTFNRYTYTGNNPINRTDPSGLNWCMSKETGITTFTGENVKCGEGFTDLDAKERTTGATGCFTSNTRDCHAGGSLVRFNANGSTTMIADPEGNVAQVPGVFDETVDVQAEQEEITTTSAGEISANITPRGALDLPCLGGCGSEGLWSNPLTPAPDGPELETVRQIKDATDIIALFPGANIGAVTVKTIVLLGQGKGGEALSELPNLLPGLKWFRKADKTVDAVLDTKRAVSTFVDATSGRSVSNIATNATPLGVAKSLKANGFEITRSSDRKALIFRKGETKYSLRMNSKSTQGPTLDYFKRKDILRKIRLGQ